MKKSITFITSNKNKLEQLRKFLDYPIEHKDLDLAEIQSLDPHEIVEAKVKEAYRIIKSPVLVEDVSLTFEAFGKLPGPLIKWFLKEFDTEGLCKLLNGYSSRNATAYVLYGYYDGKVLKFFDGSWEGTIAKKPKGIYSFGWNPIFIPKGYNQTWGEMNLEEQKDTSMRKIALDKFEEYLKTI
jgi:non-canonical purine NTP pyrophosphatase (RdgB/HAM1 family)